MADIQVSRQTVISFPDDSITLTEGIMDASLSVSEILLSKHIAFGELNINKFEVDLHTDIDVIGKKIYVYQNIGTSVVPIFTGYVQSSKLDDYGEYRHLIAYDLFYTKGVLDVADWWDAYWESNEVSTLGSLLRSLLSTFSIPYTDKVLLNDSMSISKTQEIASMKLSDMLKLICEANVCNPNINRQGVLEFVTVYNATEKSVIDNYEWNNSDFEDYELMQIGVVQIWNEEGHIGVSVGSGTNCLAIKNNFFFYDKETSELNTLATGIYNAIHGLVYKPASIKLILQDSTIKVGDMVRTSKGVSLVTEIDMSGSMLIEETLRSSGEELQAEADSYNPTDSKAKEAQRQAQQANNSVAVISAQVQDLQSKITRNYILPFGIVLDTVVDTDDGGTANNVLMFRYTLQGGTNTAVIRGIFSFNVHTFEKTISNVDYFQDAIVTVTLLLDNASVVSFVEYMRDGWNVLPIDCIVGNIPDGTHDIYVAVQVQGANLYSMNVVSGYMEITSTSEYEELFYDINDMRIWIQTVSGFLVDNYTDNINDVTVNNSGSWGDYQRIYKELRVDPLGEYDFTFDLEVDRAFVNNHGDNNFVRAQVGHEVPTSADYGRPSDTDTPLLEMSDPFPTTVATSYTSYSVRYTNVSSVSGDRIAHGLNYIEFNFSAIHNADGRFKLKNLKFKKTNSDLQFIEFASGLWVWNKQDDRYGGTEIGAVYHTTASLDAIIVRGVGGNYSWSGSPCYVDNHFIALVTSEQISVSQYFETNRFEFENKAIALSNGRIVYVCYGYSVSGGDIYQLCSSNDKVYYSTTYNDQNAETISGSCDIYIYLDTSDVARLGISFELDKYLCERWGDPT